MGKKSSHNEKKHGKKRKRSSSSSSISSSSSSSISLSSLDEETRRKLQKKLKKLKKKEKRKKKEKKAHKKLLADKSKSNSSVKVIEEPNTSSGNEALLEKSKSLAPMTKEEWEKQQNTLKRVFDKETGRMRLIKGSGEIVEECVSRERHLAINKQATLGDGEYFQKKLFQQIK